jgi:hypothetical protein
LSLSLSDKKQGIDQFVLLADASEKVPPLPKDRSYADFQFTKKDWDHLSIIYEVLRVSPCFFTCPSVPHHLPLLLYQEPSNVQQTFSNEKMPTMWRIISALEFPIKCWESMVEQPRFRDVKDAIMHGVRNLKKWYRKVDNMSSAYFICLSALPPRLLSYTAHSFRIVSDPNVKDLYCRHRWEPDQYVVGMASLEAIFDKYNIPLQAPSASMQQASFVPQVIH